MPHIYSIYEDSKLFDLVFSFAELVQTDLWAVWAEQHAQRTQFLPGRNQMHKTNKYLCKALLSDF